MTRGAVEHGWQVQIRVGVGRGKRRPHDRQPLAKRDRPKSDAGTVFVTARPRLYGTRSRCVWSAKLSSH